MGDELGTNMSDILDDLLSVLAATIIADKRVYSEEIKAFTQTASGLDWVRDNHPDFNQATALEWYETHKDRVYSSIHSKDFETWLHECLGRLSRVVYMDSIIEAINVIAKSDGEFHVSEKALQVLTERNW